MTTDQGNTNERTVSVLGTGTMGSAMARNLIRAGIRTMVWDRSSPALRALTELGAQAAPSPEAALRDARVVITMLPTAQAVNDVLFASDAIYSFSHGAVWAQMGTIGVHETKDVAERLARARPDVTFVDAPVSGSRGPATEGKLLILASGPRAANALLEPAFAAIGRKTVWLGEAGQGSRMKLVVNAYMAILIEGVAEALELATRLGVDPADLADAIDGGPLDAPIAGAKLHKMETHDFDPEFALRWALKDVDLALSEAGDDPPPLLAALSPHWHAAVAAGHGREDVSIAGAVLRPHSGSAPSSPA